MNRKRSQTVIFLLLGGGLFGLYTFLSSYPLAFGRIGKEPLPYALFGRDLKWIRFAAWVPLIFAAVRIIDLIAFDFMATRRRRLAAPQLLRDIVSLVLYFVLFSLASREIFEFSLARLFTGATVLAAILALALQETLGNLFSGIALHMENSFEQGDVISAGDHIGVVESVTWRATRMRTFNNNMVILPNSVVARERLEVYPRTRVIGRVLPVGIDYNVPPSNAISVLTQAAAHIEGVSREIPCFARVASFGDSSVVYEIKYYTRDYASRDRIDADIRKAVWYALRRNNILIPFPIRAYAAYQPFTHDDQPGPEEIRHRLQEVDILSPLTPAAHETLAAAARAHSYSKGETIIRIGAPGSSMFVVHDGTVSVRVASESDAERREVAQLGPGSVFGEMALLTGEMRVADVIALTDVTAIEITKAALQPILQSSPDLAAAISMKIAERRDHLDAMRINAGAEAVTTVLSRIRAYFGL